MLGYPSSAFFPVQYLEDRKFSTSKRVKNRGKTWKMYGILKEEKKSREKNSKFLPNKVRLRI